jgi:AbrB family looped-hinge helix DNA binding protein
MMVRRGKLMRVNSRGQVTIPADLRKAAGLLPNTEIEFEFDGEGVRILKTGIRFSGKGARVLGHLKRRGDIAMTTEEIMALTRRD